MRRTTWAPILIILGFALVSACSTSDDEILDQLPELPELDAQAVGAVVDEAIIPVLDMLDLTDVISELSSMTVGSGRAAALVDCEDHSMEVCANYMMSGYLNLCLDDVTFEQVLSFDNCDIDGDIIDGEARFTVTSETSGSAVYDLTINGEADADGTVTYGPGTLMGCLDEAFSDFMYSDSGTDASMSGLLTYCLSTDWPTGTLDALVTASGFTIRYEMVLTGAGTTTLIGYDNATNTQLVSCDIDLNDPYNGDCS
jgi:hypothetical protein